MNKQTEISDSTSISVGVLNAAMAGLFAVFLVVAGAIFWGGLLQAQANVNSQKISKLEATAEQYRLDMQGVRESLIRLELKAGTLPSGD